MILVTAIWFIRKAINAYSNYGYYVFVESEEVFETNLLKNADVKEHGRDLIEEIKHKDQSIDSGDGQHKGKFRWYVCKGIDCDEGWGRMF